MRLHAKRSWRGVSAAGLAVLCLVTAVGCGSSAEGAAGAFQGAKSDSSDITLDWRVPNFRFTDEDGHPLGLSDLRGKVWMADFMFTKCTSVCPLTTAHMAKLQRQLKQAGVNVELVSFTVDPAHDSPSRLKAYGDKFGADFTHWHFLTGYSEKTINRLARTGFKTVVESIPHSDQFSHSTEFYLVGPDGKVLHVFDGLHPPYAKIVRDVRQLLEKSHS
jgi:protein SCO1/2